MVVHPALGKGVNQSQRKTVPSAMFVKPGSGAPVADGGVRKRIGWLNANAGLAQPLMYDTVGPLLESLDRKEAMEILKQLEEKGSSVRDPTAWAAKAARGAGAVDGPGAVANNSAPKGLSRGVIKTGLKVKHDDGTDQKVRKRVGWLNANAGLQGPLMYDKIAPAFAGLAPTAAMEILKDLEEKAAEVRDPTAYATAAARRRTAAGGAGLGGGAMVGAYGGGAVVPFGYGAAPTGGGSEPLTEEKLRKRVGWMNKNIQLALPLNFDKAAAAMQGMDGRQAMEILKDLENKAGEVRDPTAYVVGAARRADRGAGGRAPAPSQPQTGRAPMGGVTMATYDPAADDKIRRRIGWLNANAGLQAPLLYDKAITDLLSVGAASAMELLKDLEGRAAEVHDPTGYVVYVGAGATASPSDKIRKRVGWLNENAGLLAPLRHDEVAQGLLTIGSRAAMEVLKELEERASEVSDPTSYVQGLAAERGPAEGDESVVADSPENKLWKRVEWLNTRGPFGGRLVYELIAPALLGLEMRKAMELLKAAENQSAEISDPNAFVVAEAHNAAAQAGAAV